MNWSTFREAPDEIQEIFEGKTRSVGRHLAQVVTLSNGNIAVVWHSQVGKPELFIILPRPEIA